MKCLNTPQGLRRALLRLSTGRVKRMLLEKVYIHFYQSSSILIQYFDRVLNSPPLLVNTASC